MSKVQPEHVCFLYFSVMNMLVIFGTNCGNHVPVYDKMEVHCAE